MIRRTWNKIRGLADGVVPLFRGWHGRLRLARAFAALSPDELDRTLADAGLSRGDLPTIFKRHGPRHRRFMKPIARYFGVPRGFIPPRYHGALRDAERVCVNCREARRCRKWLVEGDGLDAPDYFCPNAPLFKELGEKHPR